MDIALAVSIGYLAVGIAVVVLFDLMTHRVRDRVATASQETALATGTTNKFVATAVTLVLVWVLWPVLLYAAIRG